MDFMDINMDIILSCIQFMVDLFPHFKGEEEEVEEEDVDLVGIEAIS